MALKLVAQDGMERVLVGGVTLLGRASDCDVLTPETDARISRHHARLSVMNGQLFVEDCASANGTFVNGRRVIGKIPVYSGDVLRLGDTRFQVVDSEPGTNGAVRAGALEELEGSAPEVLRHAPDLVVCAGGAEDA